MNLKYREKYDAVEKLLQTSVGFKVIRKRSSPLMWVIAVILYPFNRTFMSDYTTTIFGRVYFPDGYLEQDPEGAMQTLAHEGQHLVDAHSNEPWFSLSYLFPVPLALLAVGAFWSPWCLLALAFLLPWPAPGRVHWERRGYLITMICDVANGLDVESDRYLDYMSRHYSWPYYRPVWRLSKARAFCLADANRAKQIYAGNGGTTYQRAIVAIVKGA